MRLLQIFIFGFAFLSFLGCKEEAATITKKKTSNLSGVSVDTDSESEKFSYSLGMIIGNTLKNGGIDSIDYDIIDKAFADSEENQYAYNITAREVANLVGEEVEMSKIDQSIIKRGVYDMLQGDTTLLTLPEVGQSYQGFMQSNQTAIAQRNLDNGKDYLENNKNREGVTVTETGLQYELVQEGTGDMPKKGEVVQLWFAGEAINGEVFKEDTEDSFSLVDLEDGFAEIPALAEGVSLFPYGSEFILYIPSNLAFSEARISPEIGPNSTLKVHVSKTEKADQETTTGLREYKKALQQQMQQQQRR